MSKKKSVWQRMRSGWQVYALLLLPVIYLIVFCYIPMGGLVLAFKNMIFQKESWEAHGSDLTTS